MLFKISLLALRDINLNLIEMKTSSIKLLSLLILLISIYTQLFAQVGCDELSNFKKKKDALIQIGFSTSEVKAKIGNPKSIESGFPQIGGCKIADSPKMVGQLNNSTWFYMYTAIPIKFDDKGYFVNGINTTEELYFEYKDSETVNLLDGKVISKSLAGVYKSANNNNLSVRPKDRNSTYYKSVSSNSSIKVIPIYCVIFDKGTQAVAATEAFFLSY